jgi:SH3-like domain-containing protein
MTSRPHLTAVLLMAVVTLCGAAGIPTGQALAAEYRSIGADPAILYDAPTTRGRKLAIAPRGMPVEVVVVQNDWVRVRDASGDMSWMERRLLGDRRTLVVQAPASAHAHPDDSSPVTMRLEAGVIVDLVELPSNGWINVRHRDGESGWLKVAQVWGI